jgi:predicted nuclease of predicted toxin-antitoxin system
LSLAVILDQNVPPQVGDHLRARRPAWTVWHVLEVGLAGATDQAIFVWAQQRDAVIVTFDEDFADARMYPLGRHAGVIRLRVWPTTIEQATAALDRLLDTVPEHDMRGSLVIIDDLRIRVQRAAQRG